MNRGEEYISREFHNFCEVHGIYKQFIARYTPQQNVVMERKNITIMEMVCSILVAKHFSNEYWVESVATTIYIMNRCPTKSVKNIVPQEAWTCMKYNVVHLKNFGCVAYAHVPYELRKKMGKKGQKCIFVGYSEETKGYKMYDPVARKVIISHDVQFVENEAWDGSIEKTIKNVDAMENDETKEEVVQTPSTIQCAVPSTPSTATKIPTQTSPVRSAGVYSTPRAQQTPVRTPSIYTSPYPTLESLLPRNIRHMRDILL
jgi:hypothetical protein